MVSADDFIPQARRRAHPRPRLLAAGCSAAVVSMVWVGLGSSQAIAPASVSSADGQLSAVPNGQYPVTINDCGVTTTYTHAPTRAITLEESSTEFMLALG